MGRSNKNARSRPQGRRIHVNKYINKIGRTKDKRASRFKNSAANLPGQVSLENPRPWVTGPLPRRYEIWFADLGDHYGTSVQSGNRPVLVISNDVGNQYSRTVTVIPLTTKLKRMDMPTHIILTEEDCCMFRPQTLQDSVLLAEQITTIFQFADPHDGKRGGLHAGEMKAYIQLCLAMSELAKEVKYASPKPQQTDNEKYAFRCWMLRLGFIGEEFATAREILLRNMEGNASWRNA